MIDNDLDEGPISMQALGQSDLSDSLIGAIDNPRVPDAAIAGLLAQGPSFGQRIAQAIAGGVAAMRGQANPVTAILAGQQQERVSLANMLQKMNAQADLKDYRQSRILLKQQEMKDNRADREYARDKSSFDVMMGIIKDPNASPAVLAMVQPQVGTLGKKLFNVDLPTSIIERKLSEEEQKGFLFDAFRSASRDPQGVLSWTPEVFAGLSKRWPRVPVDDIPRMAGTLNSEGVLKSLNLPTTKDFEKDAIDLEVKKLQLAEKSLPIQWRGNPQAVRELSAIANREYPGIPFNELSQDELANVSGIFDLKKQQEKRNEKEYSNDLMFQRQMQLLTARGDQNLANALAKLDATSRPKPAKWADVRKAQQDFGILANGVRALQQLRTDLAKIPDDALPTGDDVVSMTLASLNRKLKYPGQEANFALQQRYFEIMKGVFERGFLNAKATQSVKTDLAQLEALNNMPSRKTMDRYIKSAQDMIRESLDNNLTTLENSPATPAEILETAKDIVGRINPKSQSVKPGPLKPEPLQVKKRLKRISDGKERTWVGAIGEPIPPGYMELE